MEGQGKAVKGSEKGRGVRVRLHNGRHAGSGHFDPSLCSTTRKGTVLVEKGSEKHKRKAERSPAAGGTMTGTLSCGGGGGVHGSESALPEDCAGYGCCVLANGYPKWLGGSCSPDAIVETGILLRFGPALPMSVLVCLEAGKSFNAIAGRVDTGKATGHWACEVPRAESCVIFHREARSQGTLSLRGGGGGGGG